jgi:biopolymer transport protein ExbD
MPRTRPEPNVTPFIDILLVLLVIFMASLPLSQEGIDVEVPRRLRDIYAARTEKTLYISGAATLAYRRIIDVIDAAKLAGVTRVGIITEGMRKAGQS